MLDINFSHISCVCLVINPYQSCLSHEKIESVVTLNKRSVRRVEIHASQISLSVLLLKDWLDHNHTTLKSIMYVKFI